MRLKDILLPIDSYSHPTPLEAIDRAIDFCRAIDGTLTALAVEINVHVQPGWLSGLAGIDKLAETEEARSRNACCAALDHFRAKAQEAGVLGEALTARADLYRVSELVAERARSRDLCIVPIAEHGESQRYVAEDVIFGSARPTLIFHPGLTDLPKALGVVALAWDGSRCAARAMADALPVLIKAQEVRVLTVLNEKASAGPGVGADAVRHLTAYGVNAVAVEVDGKHQRIGHALDAYIAQQKPDLLVMGAYGRSRVREFILGGATEHVLNHPKAALLLSH